MQQIQLRGKKKIHKKCVVPKCTVAENRSIENHQCIELIGKLCGNDVDKKANYMKEYQKAIEAKSLKDFLKKLQVFRATKRKNAAGGTMRILFDRHFYVLSDKPSAGKFAYLADDDLGIATIAKAKCAVRSKRTLENERNIRKKSKLVKNLEARAVEDDQARLAGAADPELAYFCEATQRCFTGGEHHIFDLELE